MKEKEKEKGVSPYTILNRWFYDGSQSTDIPNEILSDKSISHMYLLHYFKGSHHGIVINKLFNNWGLFSLDRIEVFKMMKQCIQMSGYKPPFIVKLHAKKNKLVDEIKSKHPYLKNEELFMLVELLDQSDEKDRIYEMFGLYSSSKKKLTKAEKKQKEEEKKPETSLDDLLENFL